MKVPKIENKEVHAAGSEMEPGTTRHLERIYVKRDPSHLFKSNSSNVSLQLLFYVMY